MKHTIFGVTLIALSGFWGVGLAHAAGKDKQAGAAAATAASSADYVGSETCATCHEEIAKGFESNPHTKMALMHGGKGVTCENCHGPGKAHVDGGGDVSKIFRFTPATAREGDARCLSCHGGQHANFERGAHAKNVGCAGCHSIHAAKVEEHLLQAPQPLLCYSCHSDVKPAFSQPFHHKVNEGLMTCSDCHDPHGTFQGKALKTTADQNAICTRCHLETAGPFAYEHPVVKEEGCLSCHNPHGSANPRMMTVASVNQLCLRCHSATNTAGVPSAKSPQGPNHSLTGVYVSCTTCHSQIHGSNTATNFFK